MRWRWLAYCLAVASSTCGGSSTNPVNPPTPTTSTTTTFTPAPNQPVVTITATGVSPQQVCLAWMLAKSPTVIPIPGSSRPETITDSARAADLTLTDEELRRLG